jgi:hypothetical protein
MAVITINREIIEKEGWTLGEFILMLCTLNKLDLEAAKRLLIKKGLMTDHCPAAEYPPLGVAAMSDGVKAYNDIVIKSSLTANGSPTKDEELEALAIRLKEIYPKGKKDDRWPWAEGVALIKKRLQAFFVKYGRYSAEEIIDATERYVQEKQDQEDMRLLKYFIFRDKKVDGEVVASSDLLTWIENKGEESRSNDWMLHM